LGIALASGKDLFSTLLTLQTAILKLVRAEAMFIAIYDRSTDLVEYPIYFEVGEPESQPSRRLSENPGLTGAVIESGQTLYLPDMMLEEAIITYAPVGDDHELVLHTFLGIPLKVNDIVVGVLSIQSTVIDAYSADQIQLMENVAIQAALAIDKSRLLDQLKKELNERRRIEIDLRQRESILEAVAFAAEQFLKTTDWRLNIDNVLERLGKTMQVTHAYLFEKHPGPNGNMLHSLRYEWVAPGQTSNMNHAEYQDAPLQEKVGSKHYFDILDSGKPFVGSSSAFTEQEKKWMQTTGIKALLEMRIVVNGEQWGTIGFDDMVDEREWTPMEVDLIRVAANVLGAAIKRQSDEAALQNELEQRALLISELESKNQELERFTYTVSHDLKSPLVTISGFLGHLEKDAKEGNCERLHQDSQRIQEAVSKMQRLLSKLLELSRIGRIMNSPQVVAFEELVVDAMAIVHGQLEEGGITVLIEPGLPMVYGD
jgi:GAF domain-containing protein